VAGFRQTGTLWPYFRKTVLYLWLDSDRLVLCGSILERLPCSCSWIQADLYFVAVFYKGSLVPVAGLRKAGTSGCEMAAARPVRPSKRAATASFI
jgi:hypothetical protein